MKHMLTDGKCLYKTLCKLKFLIKIPKHQNLENIPLYIHDMHNISER